MASVLILGGFGVYVLLWFIRRLPGLPMDPDSGTRRHGGSGICSAAGAARSSRVQATLAAGLNFSAGALGTVANSYVSTGRPPSAKEYLLGGLTGVFAGGISTVLFPIRGVNYMSQVPYFAQRTLGGMFNFGANNTRALWGSAISDGLFGAVTHKGERPPTAMTGQRWNLKGSS